MSNEQVIHLLNECFDECGDHERARPFMSDSLYDGGLKYIRLAIEKAANLAFIAAIDYDSFDEFEKTL